MTPDERKELKEYLKKKHFIITSLGVIVANSVNEWKSYFDFAADMGIHVMVAEPDKSQLSDVNRLAGTYNIKSGPPRSSFPGTVLASRFCNGCHKEPLQYWYLRRYRPLGPQWPERG